MQNNKEQETINLNKLLCNNINKFNCNLKVY